VVASALSDFTVLDVETTGSDPWRDKLVCVGIGQDVHRPEAGRSLSRLLMARSGTVLVAHTNYDLRWLMLDGARLAEGVEYHDTKVMAWMLDGTQELRLDALAERYLGRTPPKLIRKVGGRIMFQSGTGLVPIEEAPWDEVVAYNLSDITTTAELYVVLRAQLERQGLWQHFVTEEAPFSRLLVEMEAAGTPFDRERARTMLTTLEAEHAELRARLVDATGHAEFNPGSGDQVADFLYSDVWSAEVRFAIPRLAGMRTLQKQAMVERITPPGVTVERIGRDYAYGKRVLDGRGLRAPIDKRKAVGSRPTVSTKKLAVMHGDDPWVADFIAWKRLDKLGGYLRSWLEREHDGRLHGRFDQSGTITGRLAGREPNLQQVSTTSAVRDLFRGALVVGDYAGLEVRLSAHFSGDPVMLDVFRTGRDLYGVLAAEAWGGPGDKTNEGRGLMKVLMLASQYGAQGDKLAEVLAFAGMRGYTPRKADALLGDLENTLPRLFHWRQEVIEAARVRGFVTTLAGRRRDLPDIKSATWHLMAKAERQAVNSLVQGSAADVVRRAMLRCREAVSPDAARIVLQVHDEILWERGPAWTPETFDVLRGICETGHGFELDVPLVFDAKVAESWAAKGGFGGQVKAGEYEHVLAAVEAVA
jgi:DNA polymerase I-like protein with 3'-5' exonuclease and polymerase domains